jgi:hypothetical protein
MYCASLGSSFQAGSRLSSAKAPDSQEGRRGLRKGTESEGEEETEERGGMTDLKRVPKVGNRVALDGYSGTFVVTAVHSDRMTIDAKLAGPVGELEEREIPWGKFTFLDDDRRE